MFQPTNESYVRAMVEATLNDDMNDDDETRALREGQVYRPRASGQGWQFLHALAARLRGTRHNQRVNRRRATNHAL